MSLQTDFENTTVVITGHTGFKGSWLTAWLKLLGAQVVGIALDPHTEPAHFEIAQIGQGIKDHRINIDDLGAVKEIFRDANPDYVFHLAAQSLVRHSYEYPLETWRTNVFGTLHVLEALRQLDHPCGAVIITSDKCYDNVEWVWGYRETDALGGPDPYSSSKGAAELAIRSYVKSFFPSATSAVRIASARAGNVIGGGDWASDRIVPDCVQSWAQGRCVQLRNPLATRPWQHVLEPLSGYLQLAATLLKRPQLHGEPFNFGPTDKDNQTVAELVKQMASHWLTAEWQDVSQSSTGPYESGLLKLNCDKALHYLNWQSVLTFAETVRFTTEWYRNYYQAPTTTPKTTAQQIQAYTQLATQRGLPWTQSP